MTTRQEGITYIIDAEDRATKKVRKTTEAVNDQVKRVKEIGSQSKASTELVGTLANQLGDTGVGSFAGDVAMLTERVSAFAEISKAGGAGATAFKAGLIGAAAVLSFNVGKAIGDIVFQTERWNEELSKSLDIARQLDGAISNRFLGRVSGNLDQVTRELRGLSDVLELLQKEEAHLQTLGGDFRIYDRNLQNRIRGKQREIEATRESIRALTEEKRLLINDNSRSQRESKEKSNLVIDQLQLELAKQRAVQEDERLRIELRQRGVRDKDMAAALALAFRLKHLQEAKLKAAAEEREREKRHQEQLAQRERLTLQRKRQAIQAALKADRDQLSQLKKRLQEVSRERNQSEAVNQLSAGASQRLLTGSAGRSFRKTVAEEEAIKQTRLAKEQATLRKEIADTLRRIEAKTPQLKVLGS